VIICVFGFVSLVSLTCEERRKEIAIRKIHGATITDILDIFFKEYIVLLVIGAVIAFPFGYYIMRRWLEDYVVQTPISAWVYAVILLALILAIVLCVGWKVYKTSRENPASVVKS
jgi:ABC-type antimicrobial peptide transport system permease subunit